MKKLIVVEVSEMNNFVRVGVIVFSSTVSMSCGVREKVEYEKDFSVYINSKDETLVAVMRDLTEDFNDDAGREALSIVDQQDKSNSTIEFTQGLLAERKYLGYGSGLVQEISEAPQLKGLSLEKKTMIKHSMRLQFDADNFTKKAYSLTDSDDKNWDHLYHLFSHEVGHGFLLRHDDSSKQNIMHPIINSIPRDQLDYDDFFVRVNEFFEQN